MLLQVVDGDRYGKTFSYIRSFSLSVCMCVCVKGHLAASSKDPNQPAYPHCLILYKVSKLHSLAYLELCCKDVIYINIVRAYSIS